MINRTNTKCLMKEIAASLCPSCFVSELRLFSAFLTFRFVPNISMQKRMIVITNNPLNEMHENSL